MAETAKKPMDFTKEWESARQAYFLDAVRESKGTIYLQMEHTDLAESAMDVARLCASALLASPAKTYSPAWSAEYDTWLQRATCHSAMAAQEGRG